MDNSEEDEENSSMSSSSEEYKHFSKNYSRLNERYYGVNEKPAYFWYVFAKFNKVIINNRIFKTKKEAMATVINGLRNFKSSDHQN